MKRFLDPYIGLMVLTVCLAIVLPASGVGAVVAGFAAKAGIVFLFFLYGTRLSAADAIGGIVQWKLHLAVLLCTFALFPLIGLAMQPLFPASFPSGLVTGFLFLCILPSTVQSSIAFTSIARGDVAAAICAASASNVAGVFISPFLASWLLQTQGAEMPMTVFRDIALLLLAPFLLGQVMRPLVGPWIAARKKMTGYADRGSILLIIYVAFSMGMVDRVWEQVGVGDLMLLLVLLCLLLAAVLVVTYLIGRFVMKLPNEAAIVLQFAGSKKSLASGLPMATVIFAGPLVGMVVVPLMLFHQIQLIVCAVLARHYAERGEIPDPAT